VHARQATKAGDVTVAASRQPGVPFTAPGFFVARGRTATADEDIMKRERKEYRKPYGRGDYELHRGGGGVYWQADHGVQVRLAAADRDAGDRARPHAAGDDEGRNRWSALLRRLVQLRPGQADPA
jgi:hypothetical protein